jgi:membrane protein implicated in regulation of membrane protease activity
MISYLASLSVLEKLYLACAIFGGGFFIARTILMLIGIGDTDSDVDGGDFGDLHAEVDAGHFGDAHPEMDGGHLGDSHPDDANVDEGNSRIEDIDQSDHTYAEGGLKLLTIQGLTAFIMMFGLTGFAISRSSLLGSILTIVVGVIVGLFAMWLIAKGFALMRSMQSSGNMQIYDAIGEEGTVYLTIPAEGVGKIQVTISGRFMVIDAVSQDKIVLKTGERVRVSEITSAGMLAVRGL